MALIYWGQVNAASDMTMSSIIDQSGSRTRQSIIDLISPIAAGIIESSPTIIAAAEAAARTAVDEYVEELDLVLGDDPRLPQFRGDVPGYAAVLFDADENFTALKLRETDGDFTDDVLIAHADRLGEMNPPRVPAFVDVPGYSVVMTDRAGNQTALKLRESDGDFADDVVFSIGARAAARTAPTRASIFGSSSARRMAAEGGLADMLPFPLYNGAVGGQYSRNHAMFMGLPTPVTVADGVIPASGSVGVTITIQHQAGTNLTGTINGVPGRLTENGSNYTFTRSRAGAPVPAGGAAVFEADRGKYERNGLLLLNPGKNNVGSTSSLLTFDAELHAMWAYWSGPRVMIGHYANATYTPGTAMRERLDDMNRKLRVLAGSQFFDVAGALAGADIWALTGITPTSADLAAQATQDLPPSLDSGDGIHLTNAAYNALNVQLTEFLLRLGYFYQEA